MSSPLPLKLPLKELDVIRLSAQCLCHQRGLMRRKNENSEINALTKKLANLVGSFAFRSLTFKLFAFIPKDSITTITVCFHIHALLVIPVESEWHWCAIKLIVAPKNWLNGLSCFLCMVMWHC